MYRGCMTDTTDSRLLCQLGNCFVCDESGCNNQTLYSEPEISCIKCNASIECAFGQPEAEPENCLNPVLFGVEETCYTKLFDDGTVERGCTLDATDDDPDWCDESSDCQTCEYEGCNIENIRISSCLQCESEYGADCAVLDDPSEFIEPCYVTAEPYPYSKRGCYTIKQGTSNLKKSMIHYLQWIN